MYDNDEKKFNISSMLDKVKEARNQQEQTAKSVLNKSFSWQAISSATNTMNSHYSGRVQLSQTDFNFSGKVLRGGKYAGETLKNANFSSSDLKEVDFTNADLEGADFTAADLSGADLSGANLNGAVFTSAKLKGTNFTGAKMNGVVLVNADIQDAILLDVEMDNKLKEVENLDVVYDITFMLNIDKFNDIYVGPKSKTFKVIE